MLRKPQEKSSEFSLRVISEPVGPVFIRGELPLCSGRPFPARYYRHLEQVLRRRCRTLGDPCELLLCTVLYAPCERLCSVHVEAQLLLQGKTLPFFTDGCVWERQSGRPVTFRDLAGTRFSVRRLFPMLAPRREPEWLLRTCPDWEARVKKSLSAYRFYLEPDTLVLYLPPLTLDVPLENVCRLPISSKPQ